MLRRFDSFSRMCLTLVAAIVVAAVLEADGLAVWAKRLPVGALRSLALPATATWQSWLMPYQAGLPRALALRGKVAMAPRMLGFFVVQEIPKAPSSWVAGQDLPVDLDMAIQALAAPGFSVVPAVKSANRVSVSPANDSGIAWLPSLRSDTVVQIALAGDSMMAVGLAPTLMRDLSAENRLQVMRAYRSGTGLARPEIFDWIQQYPAMLGDVQPQLVICSLGANDAQNVQIGKRVLEFGSAEWDEYYRTRLAAYLDILAKPRVRVLWIGMPVMKEKRFAQKMQHMNALVHAELARRTNTTWLDPNPMLGYTDEVFTQYRANERGKLVKMRADDGIHMTDDGALFLLPPIREWLVSAIRESTASRGARVIIPLDTPFVEAGRPL